MFHDPSSMGRLDSVSAQNHYSVIEILCSEPSGIEILGPWRAQGIVRDHLAPKILVRRNVDVDSVFLDSENNNLLSNRIIIVSEYKK